MTSIRSLASSILPALDDNFMDCLCRKGEELMRQCAIKCVRRLKPQESNREEYNRSVALRLTGQSERIFGVAYEVIRSGLSVDLPVCTFSQLAVKFGCVEAAESSQLLQNHLASVLGDSSHDALFVAVLFSLVCKWKKVRIDTAHLCSFCGIKMVDYLKARKRCESFPACQEFRKSHLAQSTDPILKENKRQRHPLAVMDGINVMISACPWKSTKKFKRYEAWKEAKLNSLSTTVSSPSET